MNVVVKILPCLFPVLLSAQASVAGQTYQCEEPFFQLYFSIDSFILATKDGYAAWGSYIQKGAEISFYPQFALRDTTRCFFVERYDSTLSSDRLHIFMYQYQETGHADEQKGRIVLYSPKPATIGRPALRDYQAQKVGSYSIQKKKISVKASQENGWQVWHYQRKNPQNNLLWVAPISLFWERYWSFSVQHASLNDKQLILEDFHYLNAYYGQFIAHLDCLTHYYYKGRVILSPAITMPDLYKEASQRKDAFLHLIRAGYQSAKTN